MSGLVPVTDLSVLRNRGVPVRVHVLDDAGQRTYNEQNEPVTVPAFVRFTNNVLADLCEPTMYGSMDGWEEAVDENTALAIPTTLGVCWGVERRVAGEMMLDNVLDDYATAIGGAFAMANGVPPDSVVKILAAGMTAASDKVKAIVKGVTAFEEEVNKNSLTLLPAETPNDESAPPVTTPIGLPVPGPVTTLPTGGDVGSGSDATPIASGI